MMSDITIVTAFYDIGRGDWTPDKGLPHYLQRTTETYIERFSYLAQMENEMIVFSTADIIEKLKPLRGDRPTKFIDFDFKEHYAKLIEEVATLQRNENFQNMIHPSQRANPEYWNPHYVVVNFLKSVFVNLAIKNNFASNELVSWLDFGYCRSEDKIPASKKWSYDFDVNKMHLFNYKEYDNKGIQDIISTNDVYILGAKIVGGKTAWPRFEAHMKASITLLGSNGLIDDDQTLMLIASVKEPELFELHRIPDHQLGLDPFVIFSDFNNEV
jgi:protein YibB